MIGALKCQDSSACFGMEELPAGEELATSTSWSCSNESQAPLSSFVANHLLEPTGRLEQKLDFYFSDIWLLQGDQRTNRLPFIGAGPWKLLWATAFYLLLVKRLLPQLMERRAPLQLNWPIRAYNSFMVASNLWTFYHGARILNFGLHCFGCQVLSEHDQSLKTIELLHYGWLFLLSRLVEWLDTVFFVLRKRERQLTKLHLFHHSFVPLISWTYLKYQPGYTAAFFPFVNSFVHSIMYAYYLLATFGPQVRAHLWWKRHLTSLQIVQFVLILLQLASIPLTANESCNYSHGFLSVAVAGASLFLWLFFAFYRNTYANSSKQKRAQVGAVPQLAAAHNTRQPLPASRQKGAQREGNTRSLSEAIEDAIACDWNEMRKFI